MLPKQDNRTGKHQLLSAERCLHSHASAENKFVGRERTTFLPDKTRASLGTLPSLGSWRTRRTSSTWSPSPSPRPPSRTSFSPSSTRPTPTRTTSSRRRRWPRRRRSPRRNAKTRRVTQISQQTASPPPPSQYQHLDQILSPRTPLD